MNTQGRRNDSRSQQPMSKKNNKAIMMISIFSAYIATAELLTHQEINEKLGNICSVYNENQNKLFKHNEYNELVFFRKCFREELVAEVNKSLKHYTTIYKGSSIYRVSIEREKDIEKDDVKKLLSHAAKLLQICKKDKKNLYETKYGYHFSCWKSGRSWCHNYEKPQFYNKLLYIEGTQSEYDLYNNYVSTYVQSGIFTKYDAPLCIIALQHVHEQQMFNLNNYLHYKFLTNIYKCTLCLTKIRNLKLEKYLNANDEYYGIYYDYVWAHVYKNKIQDTTDHSESFFECNKDIFVNPTRLRCVSAVKTCIDKSEPYLKSVFENLEYKKIIRYDRVIIDKLGFGTYEFWFTSFLIKNNVLKTCGAKDIYMFEVLVIVTLQSPNNLQHVYAIKYPVEDDSDHNRVPLFYEGSKYLIKITKCHKELKKTLEILLKNATNVHKKDNNRDIVFLDAFKTFDMLFYNEKHTTEIYKITLDIKTYHQNNREFIAKLKNVFGKNLRVKLFDSCSKNIPTSDSTHDKLVPYLTDSLRIKKEIPLDEYIIGSDQNYSHILMQITIKDRNGKFENYFILQGKLYNILDKFRGNISIAAYTEQADKFLDDTIDQVEIDGSLHNELQKGEQSEDCDTKLVALKMKTLSLAIARCIKKDYDSFITQDKQAFEKAVLYASSQLAKIYYTTDTEAKDMGALIQEEEQWQEKMKNHVASIESAEKGKTASNIEFLANSSNNICDFDHFASVLIDNKDQTFAAELRPLTLTAYEHLRSKFVTDFLKIDINQINDERFVFLQYNEILGEATTTSEIQKAIKKVFVVTEEGMEMD